MTDKQYIMKMFAQSQFLTHIFIILNLVSINAIRASNKQNSFSRRMLTIEHDGQTTTKSYIRPNEFGYVIFHPILEKRRGVLISIGGFRALQNASVGEFDHVIFLDYDPNIGKVIAEHGKQIVKINGLEKYQPHDFSPVTRIDKFSFNETYMVNPQRFQKLKNLFSKNRAHILTGDLTGTKSLQQLATHLKASKLKVSVLDLSNAFSYVFHRTNPTSIAQFIQNLKAIPFSEDAVILITDKQNLSPNRILDSGWGYYMMDASRFTKSIASAVSFAGSSAWGDKKGKGKEYEKIEQAYNKYILEKMQVLEFPREFLLNAFGIKATQKKQTFNFKLLPDDFIEHISQGDEYTFKYGLGLIWELALIDKVPKHIQVALFDLLLKEKDADRQALIWWLVSHLISTKKIRSEDISKFRERLAKSIDPKAGISFETVELIEALFKNQFLPHPLQKIIIKDALIPFSGPKDHHFQVLLDQAKQGKLSPYVLKAIDEIKKKDRPSADEKDFIKDVSEILDSKTDQPCKGVFQQPM